LEKIRRRWSKSSAEFWERGDSCAETMASVGSGLAVALQTANMELGQEPKAANITAGAIAAASARPCVGAATKRQRHVLTGNDQGNDQAVDNEEKDSEPMPNQVRIKEEDGNLVKDLAVLRARYLEPQLRTDCELPGGMLLRRPRHSQIAIKQWPEIHRQVELLEKQGEEVKLLWLLKKLRRHEIEGVLLGEPAPAIGEDVGDDNCAEVRTTIDLATSSDEEDSRRSFRPLDVETYVMNSWEVLYERTVKNEHAKNEPVKKEPAQEPRPANSRDEQGRWAAVATSERQGPSEFVGVTWHKKRRKWKTQIRHDGKQQQSLGYFDDEREAARAVDTAARRLRGEDAHGGRVAGNKKLHRLNFPTEEEVKMAQERGALLTEKDKATAAAASERQGPSKLVGVTWDKRSRKWKTQINHDGKQQSLGYFDDEREAARAVDTAARRLRGEDAHGGRVAGNKKWHRLNFPSKREAGRAKALGMPDL
jgi:hypothetical protein